MAQLAQRVEKIRNGTAAASDGSALAIAATHRDADGHLLGPHTAVVKFLNVIRPTVTVPWFLTFAAHALHR